MKSVVARLVSRYKAVRFQYFNLEDLIRRDKDLDKTVELILRMEGKNTLFPLSDPKDLPRRAQRCGKRGGSAARRLRRVLLQPLVR